jgi:hypothetical protein
MHGLSLGDHARFQFSDRLASLPAPQAYAASGAGSRHTSNFVSFKLLCTLENPLLRFKAKVKELRIICYGLPVFLQRLLEKPGVVMNVESCAHHTISISLQIEAGN